LSFMKSVIPKLLRFNLVLTLLLPLQTPAQAPTQII
jgi:hypothetical protein